jgi:hypothetical protein
VLVAIEIFLVSFGRCVSFSNSLIASSIVVPFWTVIAPARATAS